MEKRNCRQLKLKGIKKHYNPKRNQIKHILVYKRKLEKEQFIPNLIKKFYSYLINKINFENIEYFIKNQVKTQINIIVKSYRNNYTLNEYIYTENIIKKGLSEKINIDNAFTLFDLPNTTPKIIIKDILENYKNL